MNLTGTQVINTEKLVLRRFSIEDVNDMYNNWASDPKVAEFLTWTAHQSVDFTRELLEEWISKYEDGAYFNWVIELKESGQAIGNISVINLDEKIDAAEIGYCLSRKYWGHGIIPEALKAVMDYLFDVVGLNRVAACHDANNTKSGRVMDKVGMKLEGTMRATGRNNQGILYDKVWHSLIRSDRI